MKSKILAVIMVVLLLGMSLAACGGNESAAEKESSGGGGAPVEKSADDSEASDESESTEEKTEEGSNETDGKKDIDPSKKVKTSKDGELKVTDKGYYYDDGYVSAVAIFANYNSEDAYESTSMTVTAYGEDGSILGTEDMYLDYIQPGEVQASSTAIETNGKKPEKVEMELNIGDEAEVEDDKVPSYNMSCTNINESVDKEMDWTTVTGQLDNKSKNDVDEVSLVLVIRNKGKIVYTEESLIDNVKAKKKKPFEFDSLSDVPEHDKTYVYAKDITF